MIQGLNSDCAVNVVLFLAVLSSCGWDAGCLANGPEDIAI